MTDQIITATAQALQGDWGIAIPEVLSEEAILQLLADRIVQVLERGPETFFQLMYRLDISEKKLNGVMHEDEAAQKIARLIYDRQLQKIKSRVEHKANRQDDDPELKW